MKKLSAIRVKLPKTAFPRQGRYEPLSAFQICIGENGAPPTVMLYFTDGCGPAPVKVPDYPVIWCLTANGKKHAKWGMEITIQDG